MKKVIVWFLLLCLLLCCLSGCGSHEELLSASEPTEEFTEEVTEETTLPSIPPYQVAMITDYMDINDMRMNQATYEAGRDWCAENNIPFTYYKPDNDSQEARIASMEQAIIEGANVLLLPGYIFGSAIMETAENHPDVYYIALDVTEADMGHMDIEPFACPKNVLAVSYKEEIAGFLVGYAAVKMGYRDLGFVGIIPVPAIMRYGFGFIQGADHAAGELNAEVTVKYAYTTFMCDCGNEREIDSTKWYDEGTEVLFPCGDPYYYTMNQNLKMIGTDIDMKTYTTGDFAYGLPHDFITSAVKNYSATVSQVLSDLIVEDRWSDLGGTIQTLGPVSSEDLELNHICLPENTQWNEGFTKEDYATIVDAILTGSVTVSDSIEQAPSVSHITVDYQDSWG